MMGKEIDTGWKDKVNLGCGPNLKEGFVNVDEIDYGQEKVCSLNKKWPFKDNSVSYLEAIHVLEHVDSPEHFISELERVLTQDGKAIIQVPHFKSPGAFRLSHKTYYSWQLFEVLPEPHDRKYALDFSPKLIWIGRSKKRISSIRAVELIRAILNKIANIRPLFWETWIGASSIEIEVNVLPFQKGGKIICEQCGKSHSGIGCLCSMKCTEKWEKERG